jgi:hypothetical protein
VQDLTNGRPVMTTAKLTSDSHIIEAMFVCGEDGEDVCNIEVLAI